MRLSIHQQMFGLLIIATMAWGLSFTLAKGITQSTDTFTYLTVRFILAALVMAAVSWRRLRGITRQELWSGAWVGTFMFATIVLQTEGVRYTSASVAGFLTALYVVFVPFVAYLWIREPFSISTLVASWIAFMGLFVMSLNESFQLNISTGEWILLASALAAALHIVSVSRYAREIDPVRLTFIQICAVAVYSLIAMPLTNAQLDINAEAWVKIAVMAVLVTAVAFFIMSKAQTVLSSTQATLIYALEPVWAALFGYLAGERLALTGWLGGALILVALLVGSIPATYWATWVRNRVYQVSSVRLLWRAQKRRSLSTPLEP